MSDSEIVRKYLLDISASTGRRPHKRILKWIDGVCNDDRLVQYVIKELNNKASAAHLA